MRSLAERVPVPATALVDLGPPARPDDPRPLDWPFRWVGRSELGLAVRFLVPTSSSPSSNSLAFALASFASRSSLRSSSGSSTRGVDGRDPDALGFDEDRRSWAGREPDGAGLRFALERRACLSAASLASLAASSSRLAAMRAFSCLDATTQRHRRSRLYKRPPTSSFPADGGPPRSHAFSPSPAAPSPPLPISTAALRSAWRRAPLGLESSPCRPTSRTLAVRRRLRTRPVEHSVVASGRQLMACRSAFCCLRTPRSARERSTADARDQEEPSDESSGVEQDARPERGQSAGPRSGKYEKRRAVCVALIQTAANRTVYARGCVSCRSRLSCCG